MKKEIRFGKVSMIEGKSELEFKTVETEDTLQLMYDEIGCGCIDIPFVSCEYRKQGIDIVLNDEGKLIDDHITTALIVDINDYDEIEVVDYIAGTYLLMSHDEEGNTVSLTDKQVEFIKDSFVRIQTQEGYLAVIPI